MWDGIECRKAHFLRITEAHILRDAPKTVFNQPRFCS